ncbi:hypothetical protein NE619_02785 [Anaerovorax odorimutans]|uniref:NEAT domain-containing protein n=1 Tax=Anaerovorax odorimutans TaxID=109327 RepID=A0ABT1RKD3_9FIRM|nr:hypothetical protein [Anaerovorax odorimutans]MCQ4635642.1 hypothetical protein [Anaerovorax odorimutans]
MRKFSRITGMVLILIMLLGLTAGPVFGETWEFGTSGQGKNPFTPRGYLVDTEKGTHWLHSVYNNSGPEVKYSGVENGVDYLDAKKSDGSNYTFYAMTDRNPYSSKTDWIAYGKIYLFAYKNGDAIPNFEQYVSRTTVNGNELGVDPSGKGTCKAFEIKGFELEPGCKYEFGFLRGMQAQNGITLVLAEDEDGNTTGYIQQTDEGLTSAEKKRYNEQKDKEYEFISSWHKKKDGKGYTVNRVPMRFSVQTYADLSRWEKKADAAQSFLNSVTDKDLKAGKYKRSNIKQLRLLLADLNEKAEKNVKTKLQPEADKMIDSMIKDLEAMIEIAKSDKPQKANISKLEAKLKEAKTLYAKAKANVGIDIGQYGRIEVENLGEEIEIAREMDQYTPQNEINDEIEALDDAMTEVKASKVQEEQKVFYDKITGIYVIAPVDSLPDDAKLFVRQMGKETSDYKSIKRSLSEKETEAVYYRIQFYQGDSKIQPTKNVEVQMPINDDISQKSSTVYAVGSKGSLSKVNSVKSNGTQIFKRKKLSAFVMAGSTATEAEKAEARGERMAALMAQKNDKDADNKNNRLEKDQKKKEEYKDPINKLLKRNANTATFSNDVRKETNPIYLVFVAAVLAAAAVALGIRGLRDSRRKMGSKKQT